MKIYVVVHCNPDMHSNGEMEFYAHFYKRDAIKRAKKITKENNGYESKLNQSMIERNWIYWSAYDDHHGHVWIEHVTMNDF
jgi:hypothetical protein